MNVSSFLIELYIFFLIFSDVAPPEVTKNVPSTVVSPHKPSNGHKVPTVAIRGYTAPLVPQRFIDSATAIVLGALKLPQSEGKVVGIRVKLARLDARLILSRLLRTGKVSARLHLDANLSSSDEEYSEQNDFLFSLLRATKLTNKKGRRVFSPVDLMHEMLSCCPDVSERQSVTMIHYMLCRALPEDVAENFLDTGHLAPSHPYRALAKRYFSLQSLLRKLKKPDDSLKKEEAEVSTKLLKAGASVLVRRIALYSSCNETLLRNALVAGLPSKNEPSILARVLLDLLKEASTACLFSGRNARAKADSVMTVSISRWMAALCEAWRDRLLEPSVDGGESPMDQIIQGVGTFLGQTETVISLRAALGASTRMLSQTKPREKEAKDNVATPQRASDDSGPIPPYCIERLVF